MFPYKIDTDCCLVCKVYSYRQDHSCMIVHRVFKVSHLRVIGQRWRGFICKLLPWSCYIPWQFIDFTMHCMLINYNSKSIKFLFTFAKGSGWHITWFIILCQLLRNNSSCSTLQCTCRWGACTLTYILLTLLLSNKLPRLQWGNDYTNTRVLLILVDEMRLLLWVPFEVLFQFSSYTEQYLYLQRNILW